MVLFNYTTKEMTAKIVYYGPGLCGKTTNLQYVFENLPPQVRKGKMLSLATKTDRTLFFDFLPLDLGEIRGMKTRVQLYTVPGQVFYNSTRKLVLRGADGVVFVADSQQKMIDANLESYSNLEENLREISLSLEELPLVMQFNKRDLPSLASIEEMNTLINRHNAPFYEAVATTGIGVEDTLKAITKLVLNNLANKYHLEGSIAQSFSTKTSASAGAMTMSSTAKASTESPEFSAESPLDIPLGQDLDLPDDSPETPAATPPDFGVGGPRGEDLEKIEEMGSGEIEEKSLLEPEDEVASVAFQNEEDWLPEIESLPEMEPPLAPPGREPTDEKVPERGEGPSLSDFENLLEESAPERATLDILDLPNVEEEIPEGATRAIPTDTISPLDPLGIESDTGGAVSATQAVHLGDLSPGKEHQVTVPLEMSVDGRPMRLQLRINLTVDADSPPNKE